MNYSAANALSDQRVPVRVRVTAKSHSNFFTGFERQVATGGVFVATKDVLPVGSLVILSLSIGQGATVVPVEGTVAWVRERFMGLGLPTGMGIRFTNLDPRVALQLQRFVEGVRESLFFP